MAEAKALTLALLGLAIFWAIGWRMSRHALSWFHPLVLLWLLAAWDVYVPAILWTFGLEPNLAWWVSDLKVDDLPEALLFYLLFVLVMSLPIAAVTATSPVGKVMQWRPRWGVLGTITMLCLSGAIWRLGLDISNYGGVEEWFWGRAKIRWALEASDRTLAESVLETIQWRMLFNVLAFVGFYYGAGLSRGRSRVLYRWVYPAAALMLSLTTFYRGSVLLTVAGFVFVEFIRRRSGPESGAAETLIRLRGGLRKRRPAGFGMGGVAGAALALGMAVFYGVVRDNLSAAAWEERREVKLVGVGVSALSQIFQGSGLVGIAWIHKEYGRNVPLWMGETYLDAVLLPVPRSLYPAKPLRPGLLKITAALGEPESTQSAVTIPGEAFANFGYWGLAIAPLFGVMFAGVSRFRGYPGTPEFFLYPGVVFYILTIGNWMSLTGIMNQLSTLVYSWVLLRLVFRESRGGVSFASRLA